MTPAVDSRCPQHENWRVLQVMVVVGHDKCTQETFPHIRFDWDKFRTLEGKNFIPPKIVYTLVCKSQCKSEWRKIKV